MERIERVALFDTLDRVARADAHLVKIPYNDSPYGQPTSLNRDCLSFLNTTDNLFTRTEWRRNPIWNLRATCEYLQFLERCSVVFWKPKYAKFCGKIVL